MYIWFKEGNIHAGAVNGLKLRGTITMALNPYCDNLLNIDTDEGVHLSVFNGPMVAEQA